MPKKRKSIRDERIEAADALVGLIIQTGDAIRAAETVEASTAAFAALEDAVVPLFTFYPEAITRLMGHFRSLSRAPVPNANAEAEVRGFFAK